MISREICQRVLRKAVSTGADYAEIFAENTVNHNINMIASKVDSIKDTVIAGAAVRVYKGMRSVMASTVDMTEAGLLRCAESAADALGQSDAPIDIVDADGNPVDAALLTDKIKSAELQGYYGELRLLSKLEANRDDIIARLTEKVEGVDATKAEAYYAEMLTMSQSMKLGQVSLLDQPWQNGFAGINWLWLIPLVSGLTAFAASYITTRQTKKMQPQGEAVPGQGCRRIPARRNCDSIPDGLPSC